MKKGWLFTFLVLSLASCSTQPNPSSNVADFEIIGEKNEIKVGETLTLQLSMPYENVSWSSSNSFIARVNQGVVTAYNVGTCSIYAKVNEIQKEFALRVVDKDLEINSFESLSKLLADNLTYEIQVPEIRYTEVNSASNRNNEETLYRYENGYYTLQDEKYSRFGVDYEETATSYVGEKDNFFYNIYDSNTSSYVQKLEIVEASSSSDQILRSEVDRYLQTPTYLNKFFNVFQDAYSGYVNQDEIIVSQEIRDNQILVHFSSFSKNVWSNGINCDYKTYEAQFVFSLKGELRSLIYGMNNYGDEQFNVKEDTLIEGATSLESFVASLIFLEESTLPTCPIEVDSYFVSEILLATYTKEIHVNDYVLSANVRLEEYSPSTSRDTSDLVILDVKNPEGQVVLYNDGDTITAYSQGEATLVVAMRYSKNVTYELKVKVI